MMMMMMMMMPHAGDATHWTGWEREKWCTDPMSCECCVYCFMISWISWFRFLMSSNPMSLLILLNFSIMFELLEFSYVIWNTITFSKFLGYVICPSMVFGGTISIYVIGRYYILIKEKRKNFDKLEKSPMKKLRKEDTNMIKQTWQFGSSF